MEVYSLKTPELLLFKCIYVSYPMVFSHKGFYVNLVFFFIFVFHYCAINHDKIDGQTRFIP